MTIDEAIDYIRLEAAISARDGKPNARAALQLGIEALKHMKIGREKGYEYFEVTLPGETEE